MISKFWRGRNVRPSRIGHQSSAPAPSHLFSLEDTKQKSKSGGRTVECWGCKSYQALLFGGV